MLLALLLATTLAAQESDAALAEADGLNAAFIGEYPRAIESFDRALALREPTGDARSIAACLYHLGQCLLAVGKPQRALERHEHALKLREPILGLDGDVADSLAAVGDCHLALEQFEQAADRYEQAMAAWRRANRSDQLVTVMDRLATAYRRLGRSNDATSLLLDAASIEQPAKHQAILLDSLADCCSDLGQWQRALDVHQRALAIRESLDDPAAIAQSLAKMATCQDRLGAREVSIANLERALTLRVTTGDLREIAHAMNRLADAYQASGQIERARSGAEQALAVAERSGAAQEVADALDRLGSLAYALGDSSAITHYERTLALREQFGERRALVSALDHLAASYRAAGRPESALDLTLRSLLLQEEETGPIGFAESLKRLASSYLSTGRADQALLCLEKCAAKLIELTVIELANTQDWAGEWADALPIVSGAALMAHRQGTPLALVRGFNALARLSPPGEIRQPRMLPRDTHDVGLLQVQERVLGADDALLVYTTGETGFVWVATDLEVQVVATATRAVVVDGATRLLAALATPESKPVEFIVPARQLYEALLAPVAPLLATKKNLIIMRDAAVANVPFDVLLQSDVPLDRVQGWSRLPYVLSEKAVRYAASIDDLMHTPDNEPELNDNVVLVGDPVMPSAMRVLGERDQRFHLRHARTELLAIASALTPPADANATEALHELGPNGAVLAGKYRLYVGSEATRERLQSAEAILHLATHRFFDEQAPWFSGVVLSPAEWSDGAGLLSVREIAGRHLFCTPSLVVLSADRTARERAFAGGCPTSLARAFLRMGALSVIGTTWDLSDAGAASFGATFYRLIAEERHPFAQALRATKLAMLEEAEFAHPFFWAGYVLIGR